MTTIQHANSQRAFRLLFPVLCLLSSLFFTGCSTTQKVDRTDGMSLSLEVRRGESSIAYYTVASDGTLEFSGGKTAVLGGEPDWTGPLTDDEVDQLQHIVADNKLFDADIVSTNEPEDIKYTLVLRKSMKVRRIKLTGENAAVAPLENLLAAAAGRRNEAVLDSLPRPSIEKIAE